jgi:hypothetical protein
LTYINFLTKVWSKVNLKFFKYSNSKEYLTTPDIVEYDKKKMTMPVYDLILGCKTMNKLGIVLDFQTKETTIDAIILPMRDDWAVKNSMACKPSSMQEARQQVVHSLDAKYEKTDLKLVVSTDCTHLSLHHQNKLLELLRV